MIISLLKINLITLFLVKKPIQKETLKEKNAIIINGRIFTKDSKVNVL
jgi:hypothetical protein